MARQPTVCRALVIGALGVLAACAGAQTGASDAAELPPALVVADDADADLPEGAEVVSGGEAGPRWVRGSAVKLAALGASWTVLLRTSAGGSYAKLVNPAALGTAVARAPDKAVLAFVKVTPKALALPSGQLQARLKAAGFTAGVLAGDVATGTFKAHDLETVLAAAEVVSVRVQP